MPLSNSIKNEILDKVTGRTGVAYLGLSSTQPSESGTTVTNITEPSGGGYARVLVGSSTGSQYTCLFPSASGGSVSNNKQIKFDMATASWGTMTYGVLFDGTGSGARVLGWGALTESITVAADKVPVVPVNGVTISIT